MIGRIRLDILRAFAVSAALVLTGCAKPAAPGQNAQAAGDTAAVVTTQPLKTGDVSRVVSVTGSLVALQDVALSAKQGGRLAQVYVREGDSVTAGHVLARVDDSDLVRQVRSDEAAVASAQAKVRQAREIYAVERASREAAIVSAQAAYDQQRTTSRTNVASAESALKSAQANLSTVQEGARTEERLQTQATLNQAEADYKKALSDYNRYNKLHNAGAVSDAELDQYVNTRDVKLAALNSARAALQMQQRGNRQQDITQAREKVRQAEESVRQTQAALAQDAVKKADLVTALANRAEIKVKLADLQAAQAALQQAQSALSIARQAVDDTVVRAPFTGRVSTRSAEPGQVVTSSTTLLHIVNTDTVYFEPSVPDNVVRLVRIGQPLRVAVDTYPGRTFNGIVTRVYPSADAASRTFPVRVTISNANGLLRPQMFATGRIGIETHKGVVLAPRAAIVHTDNANGGSDHLFTVENDVAKDHRVQVGLSSEDDAWREVSGIGSSAAVIVQGLQGLADGAKVKVTHENAAQ